MSIKRKVLALAVSSALTTGAHAQQEVNSKGTGSVLMFPYYNLENNSNTFMHISNNTGEQKAIKVRLMEYRNSDTILEFNAYLGPYDVLPFALAAEGNGGALIAADGSCTVPELGTANGEYSGTQTSLADGSTLRKQPLVPYLYSDDAVSSINRTLRGHAEVIEMGVVDESVDVSDCGALRKLWSSGAWASSPTTDVTGPTGGLSGSSFFINPDLAYAVSIDVTAINGWAKEGVNYHKSPANGGPTLLDGAATAVVGDKTLDYTGQVGGAVLATSALLAAESIMNEVQIESGIAAETDWVVTFPTKKHLTNGTTVGAPFTKAYDRTEVRNVACETLTLGQFDRETNSSSSSGSFVPNSGGVKGDLCDSVSIVSFASNSALLADNTVAVGFPYQNGAARLVAEQEVPADNNGVVVKGLPVIGFAGTRIVNGSKSYGYANRHIITNTVTSFATNTVTSGG